jgi:hypothetical protein
MSYLDGPRLVFTGRVLTDVPTANNLIEAYGPAVSGPGWNPMGGGAFDLLDCRVSGGERGAAAPLGTDDPEHGLAVVGDADRPTAKLVDLDPEWQGSSEIWGLTVRVVVAVTGEELLAGSFRPAAFRDLWRRQIGGAERNGMPMGGSFTSVLDNVRFGRRCDAYPAVAALRDATSDDRLSIVLNLFGVYYNHVDNLFGTGGLTGVLGPWRPGEPARFVAGRRLDGGTIPGRVPVGRAVAVVDRESGRLVVDLGNAYPIAGPDGTPVSLPAPVQELEVGILAGEDVRAGTLLAPDAATVVGRVPIDELLPRAGVVTLPLDPAALEAIEQRPVALLARMPDGRRLVVSREVMDGRYVRADRFVHRIDAPGTVTAVLHVRDRGKPVADAPVFLQAEPGSVLSVREAEPVDPTSGTYAVRTGDDGTVTVQIHAADPRNPRGDVDGAVASVGYSPRVDPRGGVDTAATGLDPGLDVIVAHVRDQYSVPEVPDWARDVQPVLAQYSRLYSIMGHHLADLGDLDAILPWRAAMLLALSRPLTDPNHMPVTRDLSAAKRETILRWLRQLEPGPAQRIRPPDRSTTRPAMAPSPPLRDPKTELGDAAGARAVGGAAPVAG